MIDFITARLAFIFAIIVLLSVIFTTEHTWVYHKTHLKLEKNKPHAVRTEIRYIIMILMSITLAATLTCYYKQAVDRGMEPNNSFTQMLDLEHFRKSPVQSKQEELDAILENGGFIVMYRYTCDDCHAVMTDLIDRLSEYPTAYISSRSDAGRQLVEKHNIGVVPTVIYIPRDANRPRYSVSVSMSDNDGNTVLNAEALDQIINIYNTDEV